MSGLRQAMPALLRHEGVWEGEYRHVGRDDALLDRHRARIEVSFPDGGGCDYLQRNRFEWDDGRVVEVEHPGVYRDGRLWWDTGHIKGHAWQVDARSVVLTWRRADTPDADLYELIALAGDGLTRTRTWHWFNATGCFRRTLIDEVKVA